jgi:hypothetical protein
VQGVESGDSGGVVGTRLSYHGFCGADGWRVDLCVISWRWNMGMMPEKRDLFLQRKVCSYTNLISSSKPPTIEQQVNEKIQRHFSVLLQQARKGFLNRDQKEKV